VYNKPYDPETYSVNQTRLVNLHLEGTLLKISKVKTKLPKRAHFSQAEYETDSSSQVEYDLTKCSVLLLPQGLTKKR